MDTGPAAQALLNAYDSRAAISPLTDTISALSVADAYLIQLAQVEQWTAAGRVVRGHKVGLTSATMQQQLGVDEPDYGHLFADMFRLESQPIDPDEFISPRVEPEIAFVLRRDLCGPNVTVAEALRAVDYVLPALEIIDSRIADWRITLADTVADNASSAAVVLGSTPVAIDGLDLRLTGCVLEFGAQHALTGAGAAVLGSPVNALVWLANTVGRFGIVLEEGSVILPGSLTASVPVVAGTPVSASFAGIGSVCTYFSESKG
jgi:2-keto-4-pentenoate hydratase